MAFHSSRSLLSSLALTTFPNGAAQRQETREAALRDKPGVLGGWDPGG